MVSRDWIFACVRHLCFGNKWHTAHFKLQECKPYTTHLQGVIFSFAYGAYLTEGLAIFFPWYAVRHSICIEFRICLCCTLLLPSVAGYTFFMNSSWCTNSIHVSIVKLTLWSVSNNLCLKAGSCIPSIKRSMINSSSVVISPMPSLSNSQYLALSFNQCTNCTRDSNGCCLVSRNFVLSAMTNLFFGLIFLFITSLILLKAGSSRFLE